MVLLAAAHLGCNQADVTLEERNLDLPDDLGTLSIMIDQQMSQASRWQQKSDYRCGEQTVQCYSFPNWPIGKYEGAFAHAPDSLFHFTLSVSTRSPALCDTAVAPEIWLDRDISEVGIQNPSVSVNEHGLMTVNNAEWAYVCMSVATDSNMLSDWYQGYTVKNGRSVMVTWSRLAHTPPPFDFGRFAKRQFTTAHFQMRSEAGR